MKASLDGTFLTSPSQIPSEGSHGSMLTPLASRQAVASGPACAGSYAALPRALVVTFHLYNSFNTASYVLRNSQCKFRDKAISELIKEISQQRGGFWEYMPLSESFPRDPGVSGSVNGEANRACEKKWGDCTIKMDNKGIALQNS